jgi:hypothetical protein
MYPSDLTDAQWAVAERLFRRPEPRGQPERHTKRRVVEAILWASCVGAGAGAPCPMTFRPGQASMTTSGAGSGAVCGKRRYSSSARLGGSGRWVAPVAPVAPRDPRQPEGQDSGRRRRARLPRGQEDQGPLGAMWSSTARARSWPCGCARPTRPIAWRRAPSWSKRSSVLLLWRVLPPMRATSVRHGPRRTHNSGATFTWLKKSKEGLRRDRLSLEDRAHLCLARPVPAPEQRLCKERRLGRGLALGGLVALALAPTRLTQQVLILLR